MPRNGTSGIKPAIRRGLIDGRTARSKAAPRAVPSPSPPVPGRLDTGIRKAVERLQSCGIETFESCEGGPGHAYPEPTVRFHGDIAEGYRALAVAMRAGLQVKELRRVWPVLDGEPTGPWWELTFRTI